MVRWHWRRRILGVGVGNEGWVHAWWVGCGLGLGSDADKFKVKHKMYVGVAILVVYGSDMGLHTELSVGIVGWIVGWVPLWFLFRIQKLHRGVC